MHSDQGSPLSDEEISPLQWENLKNSNIGFFKIDLTVLFGQYSHLTHYQSRLLTPLEKKALENIVGNGENAGSQHFLLFPQGILLLQTQISIFESLLFCRLQVL